jgi:hypothetical protein
MSCSSLAACLLAGNGVSGPVGRVLVSGDGFAGTVPFFHHHAKEKAAEKNAAAGSENPTAGRECGQQGSDLQGAGKFGQFFP